MAFSFVTALANCSGILLVFNTNQVLPTDLWHTGEVLLKIVKVHSTDKVTLVQKDPLESVHTRDLEESMQIHIIMKLHGLPKETRFDSHKSFEVTS